MQVFIFTRQSMFKILFLFFSNANDWVLKFSHSYFFKM